MKTMTFTYIDRTGWPKGPWDNEPDKIQWQDIATGFPCLARRTDMGNWCGYVGVADGHPHFGKEYGELDIECHGGLTYSGFCQHNNGICHIPGEGEPDTIWWLGFDCAHYMDYCPGLMRNQFAKESVYRDLEYVKAECSSIAMQLAEFPSQDESFRRIS